MFTFFHQTCPPPPPPLSFSFSFSLCSPTQPVPSLSYLTHLDNTVCVAQTKISFPVSIISLKPTIFMEAKGIAEYNSVTNNQPPPVHYLFLPLCLLSSRVVLVRSAYTLLLFLSLSPSLTPPLSFSLTPTRSLVVLLFLYISTHLSTI